MNARPGPTAVCLVCAVTCDVDDGRRIAPHPARDIDGALLPGLDCPGSGARAAVHRIQWPTVTVPVGRYL